MSALPGRLVLSLVALTNLAACTLVGGGAGDPASPEPRGQTREQERRPTDALWGGAVALDAQELPVLLELHARSGGDYDVVLRIPELSMEARGDGSWSDQRIRAALSYGGEACPGRIALDLRISAAGAEAQGSLEARDCTGSESGPLHLARRESGAMAPTGLR